jgi:SpoVK/Ycf46/Vps4 family AAA+-type ATPase
LQRQGRLTLDDKQVARVVAATEGYSGSDLAAVCKEAAMGPIRELGAALCTVRAEDVRPLVATDLIAALSNIKPSVSRESLAAFERWASLYGVTSR